MKIFKCRGGVLCRCDGTASGGGIGDGSPSVFLDGVRLGKGRGSAVIGMAAGRNRFCYGVAARGGNADYVGWQDRRMPR